MLFGLPMTRGSALFSAVLALVVLGLWCGVTAAQRDRSWQSVSDFPIVGDDGQRVANHPVAANLAAAIEKLPGVVVVGNPHGAVTLAEFYDLNCPYCRAAAGDIGDLVDTDSDFRLVLVPYPILGIASIQAGRVELAVAKLGTAEQFYKFHRKIYEKRGLVDATRALDVARDLAFDERKLIEIADSDGITETMKGHVRLADALGLAATPSFVITNVAILGYPGRHSLQVVVDSANSCGKVLC
jgi:protein-disulfide isomerase